MTVVKENNRFSIKKKYIVGGPSRNGKTTLVNILYKKHQRVIGLPVEGLFDIFYYQRYPLIKLQKNIILREYFLKKRFTNETRTQSAKPIDFCKSNLDDISNRIPKRHNHQLQIISSGLDVFAKNNRALTWAVCDLHPERLFNVYKGYIPDLHLIIMLRDPREAICANLYWRCYPEKNINSKQVLKWATMMWIFSAQAFLNLKKKFKDDVTLFFFNDLVKGEKRECNKLSTLLEIPGKSINDYFAGRDPFFTHLKGKFLTPDEKIKRLITSEEIAFIEYFTKYYIEKFEWKILFKPNKDMQISNDISKFRNFLEEVLVILKISPQKAMEYIYSTMNYSRKQYLKKKKNRWKYEIRRNVRNISLLFQK
jgi:hypothetical protein|tara:strand:- start:13836 stop:14936 length:1101 start_codon:yes stop_codon:yes gene_type:complete